MLLAAVRVLFECPVLGLALHFDDALAPFLSPFLLGFLFEDAEDGVGEQRHQLYEVAPDHVRAVGLPVHTLLEFFCAGRLENAFSLALFGQAGQVLLDLFLGQQQWLR